MYLRKIVLGTLGLLLIVIVLNLAFVCDVRFGDDIFHYMVGFIRGGAYDITGLAREELIRTQGADLIDDIWGWSFLVTAIVYATASFLLTIGLVLAIAGLSLSGSPARHPHPPHGVAAQATLDPNQPEEAHVDP